MFFIKERVIILFYMVIVKESAEWYPITIKKTNQEFEDANSPFNIEHLYPQKYLPLSVNKYENRPFKMKLHFSENHNTYSSQQANITSEMLKEVVFRIRNDKIPDQPSVAIEHSDTLKNSNITEHPRQKKQKSLKQRNAKFLKVLEVMEFEHVTCRSSSGLEGTCLHEYECQTAGGTSMGLCADGYGTCCVIQFACNGRSSSPVGWFTNPNFPIPSNERISCTITLEKSSEDIQQIRIDFLIFELLPPTSGTCEEDQFLVSGQNINNFIPILCGVNTGQHVYIEVGKSEGPLLLSIQTVTPEKRLYALKVTQLTILDELTAPEGCLQYYQDATGYLLSFNYRDSSDIGIPRCPSYLNNLNYAMCIKRATAACSITYSNAGQLQIPNYDTDGSPVIPPKQAGVEIFNCPSDWLLISATRLCGERLNDGSVLQDFSLDAPVTDMTGGPIVVWFRSDGGYVGCGFKLNYLQNSCTFST